MRNKLATSALANSMLAARIYHPTGRSATLPNGQGFATAAVELLMLDLYGILYDDSAWRRWVLQLAHRFGLQTQYAAFFRIWDREFQPEVWAGRCEFWSALRQFLMAAGLSRGQADEIEAASRGKFRVFESQIRPFPGVTRTLHQLAAEGVRLCLRSRAPLSPQEIREKLARLGLHPLINEASDWGPEQAEAGEIIAPPGSRRVAYLGRDPQELAAAARQGFLTIAFNHDSDAQADVYIDQFDQLLSVIRPASCRLLAAG